MNKEQIDEIIKDTLISYESKNIDLESGIDIIKMEILEERQKAQSEILDELIRKMAFKDKCAFCMHNLETIEIMRKRKDTLYLNDKTLIREKLPVTNVNMEELRKRKSEVKT